MARTDQTVSGTIGADGTKNLDFRTYGRDTYTVTQVSHNGTIAGATGVGASATASLFKNGHLVSRTVAQGGAIAGEPPVTLRGNDFLRLRYTAAVVGAAVEMTVFYDDGKD